MPTELKAASSQLTDGLDPQMQRFLSWLDSQEDDKIFVAAHRGLWTLVDYDIAQRAISLKLAESLIDQTGLMDGIGITNQGRRALGQTVPLSFIEHFESVVAKIFGRIRSYANIN